ncbi:MAG: winged helix-turn-helix transcriptional regulator [Candidatus Woesearchaeota archaeon]
MRTYYRKVTIISGKKPTTTNVNDEIRWLGGSLGLFNLRDKDSSCFRIFIELLKNAKKEEGLSSDEIALKSNLSRGTVVHHLNRLIESGLVVVDKNRYQLRESHLSILVEEIKKDINRTMEDLKKIAENIDRLV